MSDGSESVQAMVCRYCGEPATTQNHLRRRSRLYIPACRECDDLLHDVTVPDITERREHVAARLQKRYGTVLDIPPWSDGELQQLGEGLRLYIRGRIGLQTSVRRRMAWALAHHTPSRSEGSIE